MAEVIVQAVGSRRARKQFLALPWTLYRGDSHWIPPLRQNQREMVGYVKHPFYAENECQTFLATRGGEVCGRIAAILNHAHNRHHNEQRGFFGFFETVDDLQVAGALLDAVRQWFAERDIHLLRGPVNPSMNYECALLVEGFDSPPMFMMTYNPDYYGRLIEASGLEKSQDLYAYWGHVDMLGSINEKLGYIGAECSERFGITTRELDDSRFAEEVNMYLSLYNRSMDGSWGFVPLTDGEIRHFAGALRRLIVPQLTSIAEIDGKIVAVSFCMPDYNARIKEIDGRLFPFGFIKLLRNRKAIKRMRMIATTVVPEYQKWGVGLVVMQGLLPKVFDWGIEECEFSWVLESNRLSRGGLEKGGAKRTKTYRIYDGECA